MAARVQDDVGKGGAPQGAGVLKVGGEGQVLSQHVGTLPVAGGDQALSVEDEYAPVEDLEHAGGQHERIALALRVSAADLIGAGQRVQDVRVGLDALREAGGGCPGQFLIARLDERFHDLLVGVEVDHKDDDQHDHQGEDDPEENLAPQFPLALPDCAEPRVDPRKHA